MTSRESTMPPSLDAGQRLWDPGSVAVLGASDNPAKWGHWLAAGALAGRDCRQVHLVNRRGRPVCGHPTVRDLHELPEPVELVAIAVPPSAAEQAVTDALEAQAHTILLITDGLDRASARPELSNDLARQARAHGARLIGPSSLGLVDTSTRLRLAWGQFLAGPVSIVTQSGQVGSELATLLGKHGSGVSRFASVGAQVDVTTEELLADLVTDTASQAVVVYIEQLRDPEAFCTAAAELRAAGKPVVVLAAGTSHAGSAAAQSHTGALTSDMDVLDAVCRGVGAIRTSSPAQAAALANTLATGIHPRGNRIAIISDSGGQGALAADLATTQGLSVRPLSNDCARRVTAAHPQLTSPRNPLDLAGAGEQDMNSYVELAETLATEADSVVLTGYFGRFGQDSPSLAEAERAVAERLAQLATQVPVLVHSMAEGGGTTHTLRRGGVPVFDDIEIATRSLAGCVTWTHTRPRTEPLRPTRAQTQPVREADYLTARETLRRAGVPVVEARMAHSVDEAIAHSRALPGRTVLKAPELTHKTEAGGVVVGLHTEDDVAASYHELTRRLGIDSAVVEAMDEREGVAELLVGVRQDPQFGPVAMVGYGGATAELWRDTTLELAPVTVEEAQRMISRLRTHAVLTGWRGTSAVDIDALATCVAAVSRIPVEDPTVAACEINPLRTGPDGVLAVDALLTHIDTTREEVAC